MANTNFIVQNGLTVGALTIDATTGSITTTGTIGAAGGYLNGAIGANTANSGVFTTLTATSGYQGAASGPFNGTIGATTPNSVVATSVTTISAGQITGYHTGAIGANTPNTGAFTTLTATNTANFQGTITAATVNATTIGNSATALSGTSLAVAGTITAATMYATTMGNSATVFTASSATLTNSISVNSANGVTAIVNGGTSGTGNIGASGATFNTVFAKATTAQYADLAECYAGDADYEPGTVVEFGGDNEVTISSNDASTFVAGVVSTNPAYLMNSAIAADFPIAVALTGRVPTKIIGPVSKGQMMVSAGNGRARAETNPATGSVIGKAVENFGSGEGIIEVVVGRI